MAGKFENFNSFVEEFNRNHGVHFSFERYETKLKQTNHMHEFFTNEKIPAENFAYRTVARELFRESVESLIAKKVNSVDHTAFLNDFDKLMDHYREYCETTGDKKPEKNGGWRNDVQMIEDLTGKINDIPADKSDFIKNSYIKRTIRLRDMRADLESIKQSGKDATVEELSRVIVYQRALEKAIKERSFLWKATHWIQGPAENRNLEMINEFIRKYDQSMYYPQAEALADENVIGAVKSKLEAAKEVIKDKELLKPRRLKEARQADERLRNPKIEAHVTKVMSGIVKESTSDDKSKGILLTTILRESQKKLQSAWRAFENAKTPKAKEDAIIKNTQDIFRESFKWVNGLGFKDKGKSNVHDKIVASQRITNLILKQYSPAMSDAAYEKYHNDYVVNDKTFMGGFLREQLGVSEMSDKDLENILDAIKQDITEKKTRVTDLDKAVNATNAEKSQKHNEALVKEAPNKSLN